MRVEVDTVALLHVLFRVLRFPPPIIILSVSPYAIRRYIICILTASFNKQLKENCKPEWGTKEEKFV